MKVIIVDEDNHGTLCIAKDYPSAIDYLIKTEWIYEETYLYNPNTDSWQNICKALGENWAEKMFSWTIDEFNEVWAGSFYLSEEKVYEREE